MIYDIGLLLLGLAVLFVGSEFLVKGSVGIAKSFRISPLVIGMTVVSFGTSAPELLVVCNLHLAEIRALLLVMWWDLTSQTLHWFWV